MTLDEAIEHAKQVARTCEDNQCAADHVQLAGWLTELRILRYAYDSLKANNAKLRELVRDLWLTGSLCEAIPDVRLQAKDGDWRTMQERVYEALGIEVDE